MRGLILCNKCRKKMNGVCLCTPEGNPHCIIKLYWKGKNYEYRRDNQGYLYTYKRAVDTLTEIALDIKKGIFDPVSWTDAKIKESKFEVQIHRWLQEKEQMESFGELSPGTVDSYRGYVKNHFPMLYEHDVNKVKREHIVSLKDALSSVKIKTRKNILNALHNFFNWLVERGTISACPSFPEVKGDDSVQRRAIEFKLQDNALALIPEAYRDAIEFLFETGLRPGEACALLCKHIDPDNRTALVERTYVRGNTIKESTKQNKKRIIPLSNRAYEIVVKHMKDKLPRQFLFINQRTGKGILPKTLWYQWHKYSALDVCLYEGTRHSFGSQLIQNNDVTLVKELMGHSDIRTTVKYLHLKMDKLEGAVNNRKVISLANRTRIEPVSDEVETCN
ncbi:MAG: tyrosine-type recombinase/integrase [Proteobacteria bacterium]|nr:tyrosine-type recombinase/integrase [Pseudomonadota bacterium]